MAENDINVAINLIDNVSSDIKAIRANMESNFERTKQSADKAKDGFKGLGDEIRGSFTNAVKSAIVAYAGFEVINKTINTLKMARSEYQENALAQNRLRFAIGYTSFALQEQAKIIGEKLKVDDTEITLAQAKISAYVKQEDQIRSIIPAILDLGAYLGSNEAAAQMLGRAFADDASELGKLKISVDGAAGSQERLLSIINGVNSKFGGQAKAAAEVRDVWDALALAWKDANEKLWTLAVSLSKGNNFAASETQLLADSQYKLDKALISTKKTFDGLVATPEQISLALKRIQKYEWDYQMGRGKLALSAVMERQQEENRIREENLKKQREANEKEIAEEKRKKAEFINNMMGPDRQKIYELQDQQNKRDEDYRTRAAREDAEMAKDEADRNLKKMEWQRKYQEQKRKDAEETKRLNKEIADQEREKIANGIIGAGQLFSAIARANKRNAQEMKNIARVEAAINTAVAITEALPNPVMVALAAAIGIAQQVAISNAKFARGGISSGGYAMVGEEGPEMMYLPSGARIYNSNETRNMTTNNNSSVTVNVLGSNGRVVEALRASLRSGSGDSLVRDLKQALAVA